MKEESLKQRIHVLNRLIDFEVAWNFGDAPSDDPSFDAAIRERNERIEMLREIEER